MAVAPRLSTLFLWLVGLPRGPLLSEHAVGPSLSVTGGKSHVVLAPGVLRIADCSGKQRFAQMLPDSGTPVKAWVCPDVKLAVVGQQCWRVENVLFLSTLSSLVICAVAERHP